MSIAGFISNNQAHDSGAKVADMLERMRSPEGCAYVFSHGAATLGWIDSANSGSCACADNDVQQAMVMHGDLFNPEEQALLSRVPLAKQVRPSEIVFAAFQSVGIRSLETHNGACLVAFHDRERQQCRIVRDRYGEHSLFYVPGPDYFAFASDMKALYGLMPPRLNHDLLSYQAFEFAVGRETMVRGIYALEPGDYIVARDDGDYSIHSWWRIWEHLPEPPISSEDAVESLSELLEDASRLRIKPFNAYAAMASGGVDSSLIAALVKAPVVYHAHYSLADFNELEYARCLADHIGAELRLIEPTKEDYERVHDDICLALGTPCLWTSFTLWMVLKRIASDGISAVFTGDGGDELFGGYHRYHLLYHDEQIRQIPAMERYTYLIDKYYGSRVERYAKIVNRCENIYDMRVNAYLIELLKQYEEHSKGDVINFMSLFDFCVTSQILLYMSERLFSHFGLRSFSPMLDYRIVQTGFSLDSRYKFREGVSKWILKKVAAKYLPGRIVDRADKRGFSAPVNRWFQWDTQGKYNRSGYRSAAFNDWIRLFSVLS